MCKSVRRFYSQRKVKKKKKKKKRDNDLSKFGLLPDFEPLSAHPTINSELCGRIATGFVRIKPNLSEIKEKSVVFEDGTEEEIDSIIFSTGYYISFPFLNESCGIRIHDNEVHMYEYVFPPNLKHQTIAFIGLVQPWGSIVPLSEMQCRWVARVFTKKVFFYLLFLFSFSFLFFFPPL